MNSIQRFLRQGLGQCKILPTQSLHLFQVRFMSKYMSKAARKRLPLTTKRASRGGFYKGKGATKQGRLTSKGKFFADQFRKLELVVPDLAGFKLKPYVAAKVPKWAPEEDRNRMAQ